MQTDFKFQIGELVDLYSGWELPIDRALKVVNRKKEWGLATSGGYEQKFIYLLSKNDGPTFEVVESEIKAYGRA